MCSVLEAIRSEITTDVSWKNNAFVGFWLGVDVVPLKCKWSLHTTFLHHCTEAQIFFLCFFSCPYPVHIRPPPPPPIPPIPWAALYSWLTAFPGHFMLDKRHATADTRHRSSIGGSLFQRAMSLGWWQWPRVKSGEPTCRTTTCQRTPHVQIQPRNPF